MIFLKAFVAAFIIAVLPVVQGTNYDSRMFGVDTSDYYVERQSSPSRSRHLTHGILSDDKHSRNSRSSSSSSSSSSFSECRDSGRYTTSRTDRGMASRSPCYSRSGETDRPTEYLSKEKIVRLIKELETAKMLFPVSPLVTKSGSETPEKQKRDDQSIYPLSHTSKAFFRASYMRSLDLQQEFSDIVSGVIFSKNEKEARLKALATKPHYRNAKTFLKMINNKIVMLLISIEAVKYDAVPHIAVAKTKKLVELKRKVVEYMEGEMRKAVEAKGTPEQIELIQRCSADGLFMVSPAEEIFLGMEMYVPKKKVLLTIRVVKHDCTIFLGFLYVNSEGSTRLVRLTRPLLLSGDKVQYSSRGITLLDGTSGYQLDSSNVFNLKANILSAVLSNRGNPNRVRSGEELSNSRGIQYLASSNTKEEVAAAIRYISINEPHLIYFSLGLQDTTASRDSIGSPIHSQFIDVFLPAQRPVKSVLEAYITSGIRRISEMVPSKVLFPDGSLLSPSHLSQENVMMSMVETTSITGSKLMAAFVFENHHYVSAMQETLVSATSEPELLIPIVHKKAIQLARNAWVAGFKDGSLLNN